MMKQTRVCDIKPGDQLGFNERSITYMCLWNYPTNHLGYFREIGLIQMCKEDVFQKVRWLSDSIVNVFFM